MVIEGSCVMERRRNRRTKKSKWSLVIIGLILIATAIILYNFFLKNDSMKTEGSIKQETDNKSEIVKTNKPDSKPIEPEPEVEKTLTISAAGDFTLGRDETFSYSGSFDDEAQKNGLPYFVAELDNVFKEDDFTTVNLETTLTNATQKAQKKFRFKGDPSYAQILHLGGIEAVNIANNHIFDYLEKGYQDTKATLESQNIPYFGYDDSMVQEVKGLKIGAVGYEGWEDNPETREIVKAGINGLREKGADIVLVHFHWGIEREYVPMQSQRTLAQFAIDSGADLILGHHPHVIQGIEEYKGKFIVYSLGNFMFGGNRNPSDKDTYVFQQTFHFKGKQLMDVKEIKVIPFSISSVKNRNNYHPLRLTGDEAQRVKQKVIDSSNQINGSDWLQYEKQ